MTFRYMLVFLLLAIIAVMMLTGDISFFFPVIWGWLRQILYNLESFFNVFTGHRSPINPDPSVQFGDLPKYNSNLVS